jgi:hypothetical protein
MIICVGTKANLLVLKSTLYRVWSSKIGAYPETGVNNIGCSVLQNLSILLHALTFKDNMVYKR